MTIWLSSDHHFGHANIIKFCNRPYDSVEEMNADLVRRHNLVVHPNDEVWLVGDLAMGDKNLSLAWVAQMNGCKVLIPGNHDRPWQKTGEAWKKVARRYEEAGCTVVHPWTNGIASIRHMHPRGGVINISHLPPVCTSYDDRFSDLRPDPNDADFFIHGHLHGYWRKNGKMIDVGVDAWAGFPVPLGYVQDLLLDRHDLNPLRWSAVPLVPYTEGAS